MPVSTYIFDFDGTLAETLQALFGIANDLAEEFDFEPMDKAEFQRWRGMTAQEILQEGRIPLWKIPRVVRRVRREQHRVMPDMEMVPGMRAVLLALKARGDRLGIATSNGEENIRVFLEKNQLQDVFEFAKFNISLFGKERALRKLVQQECIDLTQGFYVGDEVRDVQAAKQVGLQSVGVSWGFNTAEALRGVRADFVLSDPTSLLYLPVDLSGGGDLGQGRIAEFSPDPMEFREPLALFLAGLFPTFSRVLALGS
jgi:phosphoglycolate phosphatase